MAKLGIYTSSYSLDAKNEPLIKQAALLFDKIYLASPLIELSRVLPELKSATRARGSYDRQRKGKMKFNLEDDFIRMVQEDIYMQDYLVSQGIIEYFESPAKGCQALFDASRKAMRPLINDAVKKKDWKSAEDYFLWMIPFVLGPLVHDSATLADCHLLNNTFDLELHPILHSFDHQPASNKQGDVLRIVLDRMPAPGRETPWEAILDFRRDESMRHKYLALINWVNEMAYSSWRPKEIAEKLEFLYMEYKRSYELHKVRSQLGAVEVITGAVAGLLTGDFAGAMQQISTLLKSGNSFVTIQAERERLPGRETSYLFHAGQRFKG